MGSRPEFFFWPCPPSRERVVVEQIEPFDARGMKRVYGREDGLPRTPCFHLDIFAAADGRVRMRCWARGDMEDRAYEVTGWKAAARARDERRMLDESEIPSAVRRAYERWGVEEW